MTKSKQKTKKHYISNKEIVKIYRDWQNEIEKAKKLGLTKPKIPDEIAKAFINIAEHYSRKSNFARYPYRDEMIAEAVLACIAKADKFDPNISENFLSYFTMITHRAFINVIKREKKILKSKIDYIYKNSDILFDIIEGEAEHADTQREILQEMFGNNYSMIEFGFLEKTDKKNESSETDEEYFEQQSNKHLDITNFFEKEEADH